MKTVSLKINNEDILFNFRENSEGDIGVIKQIFLNQDYDVSNWVQGRKLLSYHNEQSKKQPSLIVDAGANIGASVVYFHKIYQDSFIFSVEPDYSNWQILERNTKGLNGINFNGAISGLDGELEIIDPGRSDWGFMTKSVSEVSEKGTVRTVKSISPNTILSNTLTKNMTPLIMKIDIEGGEDDLFKVETNWLDLFALIIIELHDWMLPFSGSSKNFLKAVSDYEFDLVYKGENLFLFNRKILQNF